MKYPSLLERTLLLVFLSFSIAAIGQQGGSDVLKRLGYPADAKLLILHADDLGMSHSVNMASFEALRKGYVSSASIMVPCPWFNEAAEFARQHPEYDFGLHLTLTSEWKNYRWRPVSNTGTSSLLDAEGYLPADSGDVARNAKSDEATSELQAQLGAARRAGIRFSHLDNHMGALSQNASLFAAYVHTARQAGVLNLMGAGELKAYSGSVAARDLDIPVPTFIGPEKNADPVEGFRSTFSKLGPGFYFTIVHLGFDDTELRAIMNGNAGGAAARQADFNMISNPRFLAALKQNHIRLVSWGEIARHLAQHPSEHPQP